MRLTARLQGVTPEAEAAFEQALALDPKDRAARYYVGLAAAARGDTGKALGLWRGLLDDVPANSAVRMCRSKSIFANAT